ncbi:MAG: hypothetical protein IPH12_01295 [Saprospirales bacterium]|nr:hypothetical protein [Saprospirales bacterium]
MKQAPRRDLNSGWITLSGAFKFVGMLRLFNEKPETDRILELPPPFSSNKRLKQGIQPVLSGNDRNFSNEKIAF